MSSLVRLDGSIPEVYETRTVVATTDRVAIIALSMILPRLRLTGSGAGTGQAENSPRDLNVDVLYGGVLTTRERPAESLFRFEVRPPRPLAAGERHRLALRLMRRPATRRPLALVILTPGWLTRSRVIGRPGRQRSRIDDLVLFPSDVAYEMRKSVPCASPEFTTALLHKPRKLDAPLEEP